MFIKKLFQWIYNKIISLFIEEFNVTKDGKIFIVRIEKVIVDIDYIVNTIIRVIKKMEKVSNEEFYERSKNVDEFFINIIVLISFRTQEGYRANERNILTSEYKLNNINYEEKKTLLKKKIIELFEEYNIESIDGIIVKII